MRYVVYVNNNEYEANLKEIKKQMKDFLEVGDKVIYIRTNLETHITVLSTD
jgi:hypothetical protein